MKNISRRTLLRGVGVSISLPFLEAMSVAATPASPTRMAFLFVPNGINMAQWTPAAAGALELTPTLAPLAKVKSSLNVLSGLAQMNAFAGADGPGDHARSCAAWLTGVHPRKTAGADIEVGISADQVAALHIGDKTEFASLELGCERGALAGDCDSGYSCAYSSSVSWRGPATPNAKEVNPRAVFERLFGNVDTVEAAASRAKRAATRSSILDFVMEDTKGLRGQLGGRDQVKLDEYLESVRDIEKRLQAIERAPSAPKVDAAMVPKSTPQDRGEHIRLMGDMMVLAFQADLTRICTMMLANEGSNRPYREIEITDGHHDISHHGNDPAKLEKKKLIDTFHVQQLAYILEKMQATKEPGGTMLDNTILLYGGGISDGNRHNHDELPLLLAGKGGGKLKTGRHMVFPSQTPMNNLLLSMLDYCGVDVEKLGDSTGKLQGLF